MGMYLQLTTLSDENIERVQRDPPLIQRVLAPDDPAAYEEARAATPRKRTLWSKLFGGERQDGPVPDLQLAAGERDHADLDKAWHGIHYLLTGTAWEGELPLAFLLLGGEPVGDDEGYGPPRVLRATATREVRDALRALGDDDLRARFDPADMLAKEIYPEIWGRSPGEDDTLGYLIENVQTLRGFLDRAVAHRLGLVVTLT